MADPNPLMNIEQGRRVDDAASEKLIEAVARALEHELGPNFLSHSSYRDCARAALAAIEASGHAIVPVHDVSDDLKRKFGSEAVAQLEAMLAARPKVLP